MSAYILSACRSPVAPRGGALATLLPHDLARPVLLAALSRAGVTPDMVDEVIISNALGAGGNPARVIALGAGLPERIAGLSIDRQCAGGMDALLLARQMIRSGDADVVVAGGVESYSRRPIRMQTFADARPPLAYDQAPFTPWPDRDPDMSVAADALAKSLNITRQAQDEWAMASHAKALANPVTASEVITVNGLDRDAFTRALSPALCRRAASITGNITAANAAVAADAAAFCVVVSERILKCLNAPKIEIIAGATIGGTPDFPGLAPLAAIAKIMDKTGLGPTNLAAAEIMEAYAVQAIACVQGANLNPKIVNQGGGALARGHPVGASGSINAVRLFHTLRMTGGTGLAAIAAAGGIGTALILRA
ncbi:MAG: thiolase family protein [Sulfitobacter sp.]